MPMRIISPILVLVSLFFVACQPKSPAPNLWGNASRQEVRRIQYQGTSVDVVIDKPDGVIMDVMLVYHGTVMYDSLILAAAQNTLDGFKGILNQPNMMLVSVAYPEENLLMGDNVKQAEAALLWVKNRCSEELGIQINKVFLGGHSQGGYIVTRLNTMHATDGVIANAPGPLNLVYRCGLEENGQIPPGITCNLLAASYGSTTLNPQAYFARSLLNFTQGQLSDILLVQGMGDSPIQLYSWPTFKQDMVQQNPNVDVTVLEIPGAPHAALFISPMGATAFNEFIERH
ncbi:MAG: hypothetical protein FGM54_10835 [Chitinophagaceae bacterium]|nr:hypothetical protein [Chitinophagaceae bacterium]